MEKDEFITVNRWGVGTIIMPKVKHYTIIENIGKSHSSFFEYYISKTYVTNEMNEIIKIEEKINSIYVVERFKTIAKFKLKNNEINS